ncbi:non-ribosomal peptide synthetase [Lentzea sp. CA-135723]|uniref:non-ribosomal peptide synthetase n=1 Tax=Lentzea sp. CA-135723 TaxID=3239950 RepID=UPI003D8B1C28
MTGLPEHFERVAAAHPDKIAVHDAGGSLTYGELLRAATEAAWALRAWDVEPGDRVGVYGQAGRDSIVAMLGTAFAGASYVPIDPTYPAERARWMAETAGARLLLLTDDHSADLGLPARHVKEMAGHAPAELAPSAPDAVLYTMYTSGSSGQPKPVAVPQRGIVRLARPSLFSVGPDDGVLATATLAFDSSALEIWCSLLSGATVFCVRASASSLHALATTMADPRVTVAHPSPSIFALMVDHHLDALGSLRLVTSGGDVMSVTHATRLLAAHPGVRLVNTYGPTEASVISAAFDVARWDGAECATMPIGFPAAGAELSVVDEDLREVEDGTPGELLIGGDRLALGYAGEPDLTASRFVPFAGATAYRTGDRVRLLPSGALEFLGRLDDEVKVRGYRVNPAESAAVLAADPAVAEAVVVAVGEPGARSLVGFVRSDAAVADLRERAWARAPRHVVPEHVVVVAEFPTGPTGKVDKRALAELWERGREVPAEDDSLQGDAAELARLWTKLAGGPPEPGQDFFHSGGTSLGLIRLIEEISARYGVELDFAEVYGMRSFDELRDMVVSS